ncbi:MAG: PAS domain-containing protein, partial [Planctomycetes bacterium]|nr:PAS domain-containing protein [Planctomycetota bacterium]
MTASSDKTAPEGRSSENSDTQSPLITSRLDCLKSALDNAGTNVFLGTTDLELVYMNTRAEQTLRAIEDVIEEELGLSVDELIGSNLVQFFGSRAKEFRRKLSNPDNLPLRAEISLGELTLDLNINAVENEDGEYIGQVVNWEDITAKKKAEIEQQRLEQMVENSPTPVILADADFNITYMNPISLETLKKVAQYLPCPAEEIVGKNVDFFHKNPAYQRGILGNN